MLNKLLLINQDVAVVVVQRSYFGFDHKVASNELKLAFRLARLQLQPLNQRQQPPDISFALQLKLDCEIRNENKEIEKKEKYQKLGLLMLSKQEGGEEDEEEDLSKRLTNSKRRTG